MNDMAVKEMEMHVRQHVMYPATKKQIVEGCNMMAHVPDEARRMAQTKLRERMYLSADEVLMDIGMPKAKQA